ncbi:MAG: type II secretion system F family protein [Candidatus Gracilibacteria bacterium]|nr:type II secretion system F family protein [Candidatus Gracilibacteria bacterium]
MEELIIQDTPQEVTNHDKKTSAFSLEAIDAWLIKQQKITTKQKVIFFRLLATMVNAGLPMLKSLTILQKQEPNPILENIYTTIIDQIKGGKNLSNALRNFDGMFTDAEASIIESGEKTGRLNTALLQLADQVEKVSSISNKIKGALIYPAAIVVVMIASIMVLMTLVVPKLVEMFGDKSKLPPLTQFLMTLSDFFVGYWWAMIIAFVAIIIAVSIWKKTETGRYQFDGLLIKLPIFGPLLKKVILSKFARVLSNLISSGISIVESLRIVSDVVDNDVYRQRILVLREDVKRGVKIGESLEDDHLFPEMLVQMIKVGEETAKLDSIILKIADFYDEEVDTSINAINKSLEPIIIVVMAVVVGFIAVGIMQPIMNLSETIENA